MWEYTKYYLAPLTQVLAMAGLYAGGDWVWVGLAFFPLMALIDSLLPRDVAPRRMTNRAAAFVPIWLSTLLAPATYVMLAWAAVHHDLTTWQTVGAVMSCAWLAVVPRVSAT